MCWVLKIHAWGETSCSNGTPLRYLRRGVVKIEI